MLSGSRISKCLSEIFQGCLSLAEQRFCLLGALVWVKSFWRVGEKGLSRTGEERVDVYADVRSEICEAGLGFCLGSLPPSFSVTEN